MAQTSSTSGDALLFERFLAGDNDAFHALFRAYNPRLYLYCVKLVGDAVAAEDLMQEMWERVIMLRGKPQEIHNPLGFLLRMARNLCLDYLKSPRRRTMSFDDLQESSHPVVSDGADLSELEELVLTSLDSLSFEHREVLVLNFYCGYRFDEIAVMLGKSSDAVWARASRARAQLRRLVADEIARRSADPSNHESSARER